ncbi:MAG TPA: lytic transglycosylase domain-containing protein [Xanthobacteraceae bacterium]|nr:lytic transglycosylase domain-containing protein [Xanthobacteraceae bacterium]
MAVEASTPIGSTRAATAVTSAIRTAANATGTSFSYLLATAKIESDLDPSLTMKSSSASGLFQFIDQTWLGTLKQAGPAFGYGDYANAISRNASGHYSVNDPQMRREIMKLRNDPTANAVMAGALTQQNAAALSRRIGRQPTESELYIAHFFGAGGAGKLIELAGSNPQASAASTFPLAAQANRSIFYDRQGNARSIAGVYSELARRFTIASDGSGATLAGAAGHPMRQAALSVPLAARAKPPVTDVAAVTRVFAAAAASAPRTSPSTASPLSPGQTAPTFNSLFSDQDRRTAVDPTVAALWSVPTSPPQDAAPAAPPAIDQNSTGATSLDLFRDTRPNAGALFGGSS